MGDEKIVEHLKTLNGINYVLDQEIYEKICDIDENNLSDFVHFNHNIEGTSIFPGIIRNVTFIATCLSVNLNFYLTCLLSIIIGIILSYIWKYIPIYKINFIALITNFYEILQKFFIIPIICIALSIFYFKDINFILAYLLLIILGTIIQTLLVYPTTTLKLNNDMAIHTLNLIKKKSENN